MNQPNLYQAKQEKVKDGVETAWAVIDHHVGLAESGEMSTDDPQKRAAAAIKSVCYQGGNYY